MLPACNILYVLRPTASIIKHSFGSQLLFSICVSVRQLLLLWGMARRGGWGFSNRAIHKPPSWLAVARFVVVT